MKKKRTLTLERVRELLDYDPRTGSLIWKVRKKRAHIGAVAGCYDPDGYLMIGIDNALYRAHRLMWFYHHGKWPDRQIDHINGVRDDNRIENLREASPAENMRNSRRPKTNTSGVKGVSYSKLYRNWQAQIKVNSRSINLGSYPTREQAAEAYRAAAIKHHGDFARFD